MLVEVAEESPDFELGITLTVGGSVITGNLVGRTAWLAKLHDAYGDRLPLLQGFVTANEHINAQISEGEPPIERHIHLKDAAYVSPGGQMPATPSDGEMFWRGRLLQIDGWSMGIFARRG